MSDRLGIHTCSIDGCTDGRVSRAGVPSTISVGSDCTIPSVRHVLTKQAALRFIGHI